MDSGILRKGALGMGQIGSGGRVYSAPRDQIGVERSYTTWIISLRESGNSKGQKIGISFSFLFQEEQHRSHENCLDAASDDLLDLQRNLPERRGRSRELEEYRLRKEYLEHEVSSLLFLAHRLLAGSSAALSWLPVSQTQEAWLRDTSACSGKHRVEFVSTKDPLPFFPRTPIGYFILLGVFLAFPMMKKL